MLTNPEGYHTLSYNKHKTTHAQQGVSVRLILV